MADNGPDFGSSWDLIPIRKNETQKVKLVFTANQSLDVAEWAFHLGGDGQYTNGECFPQGTVITFDNMSLVDLTGDENDYPEVQQWERAEILTNQIGYFSDRAKKATLLSDDDDPVEFTVTDGSDNLYTGTSTVFGYDEDSDDYVHVLDFSELKDVDGSVYITAENGAESRGFHISDDINSTYSSMLHDALNYFYQNRSGINIEEQYITSGDKSALARSAGHTTDNAEIEQVWGYNGSSGTVDVTGGWYDAGDHGKYVVNGGFSLWMMQNQYETALKYGYADAYADGTMSIPENNNGNPDLLDEARWEMEWMFKMIVDSGEYEGMAYHKAHDEKWTALGIAPADDEMKRIVKPPTTAATLNLAACAAQAYRLWKDIDPDFAEQCLEAAENAYKAAKKHPDMLAPLDESIGGGAYGDTDVDDEFYWAACELFLATGDDSYYEDAEDSDFFLKLPVSLGGGESVDTVGSFDWGNTAALGTFSFALNEDSINSKDYKEAIDNILSAADHYIELEENQGYGLPYGQSTLSYNDKDKGYIWGSNSFVLDNSVVMAYAYLLSGDDSYMDGVLGGVDYILGRNAMDYSYVTGYGTHAIEFPHHRYWANQIDAGFPKAPNGVLSGGPNSGMQDPWVQGSGWKKGEIAPQKCYLDHIEAWSVNECTINWNASLAWVIGFTAQENGGISVDGAIIAPDTDDSEKPAKKEPTTSESSTAKDKNDKNDKDDKTSSESDDDNDSDKSNIVVIALISGAVVIGLISIEIFVYKIIKMKKKQ